MLYNVKIFEKMHNGVDKDKIWAMVL